MFTEIAEKKNRYPKLPFSQVTHGPLPRDHQGARIASAPFSHNKEAYVSGKMVRERNIKEKQRCNLI